MAALAPSISLESTAAPSYRVSHYDGGGAPPSYSPAHRVRDGEYVLERGPDRARPLAPSPSPPPSPTPSPPTFPLLGHPTSELRIGHPLLSNGNVLIYPVGFTCVKCRNTGYKKFNPTHPCKSCWEKHSRPYANALLEADWESPPPNFQRPLSTRISSTSSTPSTSTSTSTSPGIRLIHGTPPPGSFVLPPGDPRIGGQLCWKCLGKGKLKSSILDAVFDPIMCRACNGLGRVVRAEVDIVAG